MVKVVIDASCFKGSGGGSGTSYDDTAILERLKKLENRTDNFVNNVTVSRDGNKIKLKYIRVDGTSSEVEFDDKDTLTVAYDDSNLRSRVEALEAKPDKDTVYDDSSLTERVTNLENRVDKDTVYDDTALSARVTALENKPSSASYDDTELRNKVTALEAKADKDEQELQLEGKVLSITNGNSVTLPVGVGKEFVVTSDTEGVVVTKTEADATTTYNVNLDDALNKFYKKAETYTKKEVDNLLTNQENKATDLTVYRGSFTDRSKVMEGEHDAPISPRVTLTYSSSTGVGIFKIDFKVTSKVNWRDVIATLPPEAPVPVELVESQVWIGNNNTSVWIDKGSRNVQIFGVSNPEMFNKRIILSIPGIFKKA